MIPELPAPQNRSQPQFAPQFNSSTIQQFHTIAESSPVRNRHHTSPW